MNNDLIERIARAIFNDDPQWDRFPPEYRAKYIQQARAALTVMQREAGEPTKAMIDLAERAIGEWFATHDGEEIDCRALARIAVMQGEVGGLREALTDWLNAFKADPFSTGAGKVDRLLEVIAASPPVDQGRIETMLLATAEASATHLNELVDLKQTVIAFAAPWAAQYAADFDLPKGHLHPAHYDILEKCGARMDDFTRAALTNEGANP